MRERNPNIRFKNDTISQPLAATQPTEMTLFEMYKSKPRSYSDLSILIHIFQQDIDHSNTLEDALQKLLDSKQGVNMRDVNGFALIQQSCPSQ